MTTTLGGLRSRFLHDSFVGIVRGGLQALGWFDVGRSHKPVTLLAEPLDWDQPVEINTLAVTSRSVKNEEMEVGSNLSQDAVTITVDVYAQNDSLGMEITNDLRDLLRGRLPYGALRGSFPILDFRMATPAPIGYATIDQVDVRRPLGLFVHEWTLHMYSVDCTVLDAYLPTATYAIPSPDLFPVGNLFPGM